MTPVNVNAKENRSPIHCWIPSAMWIALQAILATDSASIDVWMIEFRTAVLLALFLQGGSTCCLVAYVTAAKAFAIPKPMKHGAKTKKMVHSKPRKTETVEEPVSEDPRLSERFLLTHTLRPPYSIILDTNFINDCIRKKCDAVEQLMGMVNGSIRMCIPDCVVGELEKLGRTYRVALAFVRQEGVQRLECDHQGTYADNCIVSRVSAHRCYIVATSDTALRQRIKAIPGVPLITFRGQKCFIERFIPATL